MRITALRMKLALEILIFDREPRPTYGHFRVERTNFRYNFRVVSANTNIDNVFRKEKYVY